MQFGSSLRSVGLVVILAAISAAGQQYTISTYAGGAPPPTPASAVNASIGYPDGVVTDGSGNVYFTSLNCLFKIDASGTLTRLAGTSREGYSGDGGPATNAQLNSPYGVAVDAAGNLYIADNGNNRVRKIAPNGIITTVAGNGQQPYFGDGGPAISAQLGNPQSVAVDVAGDLFIADTYNNRIRKVSPNGLITTVAGNGQTGYSGDGSPAGSAQLSLPNGVAVDAAGNVFIADAGNYRVRKVSTNGTITTVAGNGLPGYSGDGGPATSAQLRLSDSLASPAGVAADAAGNLFITDCVNNRIRKVSLNGIITTVAGGGNVLSDGGPATNAQLYLPTGVALDGTGSLLIAEGRNYRVRKVSPNGVISTLAGNGAFSYSGDGGTATSAQLSIPAGVVVDTAGNLFIADYQNSRVRKVSPNGLITTVAGGGNGGDGGPAASASLNLPTGVALDAAGNLFIADASNYRVRKVSPNGIITTVAGGGTVGLGDGGPATNAQLNYPSGVAVDAAGNLYIADYFNSRVRKVSPNGLITTVAGNGQQGYSGDGGPATSAQLNAPNAVALDAAGNLFIADINERVRKVSPNGIITTVAGGAGNGYSGDGGPATSAQLNDPEGVAVDTLGNLLIADLNNNVVRRVSPNGIISTVAGSGQGYSGDGGPATKAQLFFPTSVAVDAAGNIYIADSWNNAVRVLTPSASAPPPSINANGVVDGAGYKASVAPGGIASVFGSSLANATANSATLPLPTTLAGASLTLGGKSAPLFYASSGQLNFQVPWELSGLTQSSAVASVSSVAGSAQAVSMNVVSPGIFTVNASGSGQGVVTVSSTGQTAAPATPAPRGQYVTIYCSGLGPVSNQPATGSASPVTPLSNTLLIPSVTIGGIAATVQEFSGLAPGLVGLYQVNVQVPGTVSPGPAVSLALTINGVSSNSVTIAVQ